MDIAIVVNAAKSADNIDLYNYWVLYYGSWNSPPAINGLYLNLATVIIGVLFSDPMI